MKTFRFATAVGLVAFVILVPVHASGATPADIVQMRERMVEEVVADMRRARQYTGRERLSEHVHRAISDVPRHEFVPGRLEDHAYDNNPLPIGQGQTISQPFIVALMTELLEVDQRSKILEVGTGSGYQAAVLAEFADEVYTIEIVEPLARDAGARLNRLGYDNVHVRVGDGTLGWPDQAPFDGIIVTAAGIDIPQALLDQMAVGAKLVMPVGAQHDVQQLMVITRESDGTFSERRTIPVRFVPITGDNAR